MDYLKIGRATDIKDPKQRKIFRLFEVLPGALSWATLLGAVILSWLTPFFVSYFLVVFVVFWLARSIYFAFHLASGFKRMRQHQEIDWLLKIKQLNSSDFSLPVSSWQDIYHLILLPTYKESLEVVSDTLESLAACDYPKDKIMVVVSFEERAGEKRKETARALSKRFENSFFRFMTTFHPADLPGEIPGHGSNDAWAVRQAKELVIDPLKLPYDNIIVSSFDIDTKVFPRYFSCLAYHYLTVDKPTRTSFQPIPLYSNNIWQAPAISQVSSFTSTFWQIMCQERPENLVSFSSHSMSFRALHDVGFKQTNIVPDDSRIFWQCFFKYNGDYKVVPLYYPVSMDANVGENLWITLKQIYKQQKRWAYGVEDIPYFLYASLKNKEISWRKEFSRGAELIIGHWSWATASILIFTLGWLPIFLGGSRYAHSVVAYSVPRLISRVMTVAMIGIISSVWYSSFLLPPKPPGKLGKRRYLIFVISWLFTPISLLIFGSFPALDAQTHCMLGKYLGFWVTPKTRKKNQLSAKK